MTIPDASRTNHAAHLDGVTHVAGHALDGADDHPGPSPGDTEVGLVDHRHPDGKVESHPAPRTPVAGDGHAHTH